MIDKIEAWRCIGCGKIEAPQTCIGVCSDRKIELVYAAEHERLLAELHEQTHSLEKLVRQLATITPRPGEWESSYRALQSRAQQCLSEQRHPTADDPPKNSLQKDAAKS